MKFKPGDLVKSSGKYTPEHWIGLVLRDFDPLDWGYDVLFFRDLGCSVTIVKGILHGDIMPLQLVDPS